MILEVIATTLDEALALELAGVDRIELIAGPSEGGLTPSYSLVKHVVNNVKTPVNVMIRPHSKSFVYSNNDLEIIIDDINKFKELGVNGIVFGCTTIDNKIDVKTLDIVLSICENLDFTFHRAFDTVTDQIEAFNTLSKYPINRILTSGGKSSVMEGVDIINNLHTISKKSGPIIMAGSGLNLQNIQCFKNATNVSEFHFGRGVRYNNSMIGEIDTKLIADIKYIISK